MNKTVLEEQLKALNDINYKGDESFYKLSNFVVNFITLIRQQEDELEWTRAAAFEVHKEDIKRRKSKSQATFQKFKSALVTDLETMLTYNHI